MDGSIRRRRVLKLPRKILWMFSKTVTNEISRHSSSLLKGRVQIRYFEEMEAKICKKINGWKTHILSFGGKTAILKSVLASISIYSLPVVKVPLFGSFWIFFPKKTMHLNEPLPLTLPLVSEKYYFQKILLHFFKREMG